MLLVARRLGKERVELGTVGIGLCEFDRPRRRVPRALAVAGLQARPGDLHEHESEARALGTEDRLTVGERGVGCGLGRFELAQAQLDVERA